MDKKKLDELFREKFKNFREVPDEKVWTAIENSLDKKRKRGVIPLWWQLGGVAAILTIALVVLYPYGDGVDENPTMTDTKNTKVEDRGQDTPETGTKNAKEDILQIPKAAENGVVSNSKDTLIKNTDQYSNSNIENPSVSDKSSENAIGKREVDALQIPKTAEDAVAGGTNDAETKNLGRYPESGTDKTPDAENLEVTGTTSTDTIFPKNEIKTGSRNRYSEKTQVTANEPDKNKAHRNVDEITEDFKPILKKDKEFPVEKKNADVAATSESGSNNSKKREDLETGTEMKGQDGIAITQKGENIISGRAQDKETRGAIAVADDGKPKESKKSIFETLEEQAEEEKIANEAGGRWSAGPSVAPVYFNAMGEGSPIDPGFSPNAKSGSTNLSYGLSVAYAVSKKLSVRSGLYRADYGYNTNNVGFSPTLAASTSGRLQNIDFAGGSRNPADNSPNLSLDASNEAATEFSSLNSVRDGTIAQSFGYLEVPLELDYALIDRRFGVNLVGGVSSLFLIDNSVTLNSGELTTEIGEARNLNDLNFSTNIGFGVNYKFTPKVQLNIEPVFKYQLNTFSNVSGDFRPFSIGVYSGVNFKF